VVNQPLLNSTLERWGPAAPVILRRRVARFLPLGAASKSPCSLLFLEQERNCGEQRVENQRGNCDDTARRKRPASERGLRLNEDQERTENDDADLPRD